MSTIHCNTATVYYMLPFKGSTTYKSYSLRNEKVNTIGENRSEISNKKTVNLHKTDFLLFKVKWRSRFLLILDNIGYIG